MTAHSKKSNTWRAAAIAAGAMSAVLLLSGCTGAAAGSSSSDQGTTALSVGYVPKMLANPYFDQAGVGAEEAVKELNGDYVAVGPQVGAADAQVPFINTLAQQGRNGIILSASDPSALGQALTTAREAGTKVVTFDSDVEPEYRDLFVSPVPDMSLSKAMVDVMIEQIGEEGKIAILGASPNAKNQNAWISGIEKDIADSHPGIEIVEKFYGNDDDQESFDKTAAALQKTPGLSGIISTSTVGTASAARYISSSSFAGNVALTGIGMPNATKAYLEDGTIKKFVLFDPADMGRVGAYAIRALLDGDITGKAGDTFTAGDLGEYTVEEGGIVQAGEPIVFDLENIDQYNF
ncbi:rhamnose ABC transporter substrate-binding protein [Mycetocola miduiensis]|uniref:Rhamnose transport system substrate-binding protein n=1 Tax=Mycetocola miduiensis TaxID=995034 RepID=A0A1I4Y9P7_9MICO|nr:rhamnose ABC transporter substrate-binding protein [Mycetocola miduiensis]SFN34752.1 rhamnose transport system substrate-binding protein [Mycetocola miduiensis]